MTGFIPGEKIILGEGGNQEDAVIATVGTAGATSLRDSVDVGAKVLPVTDISGFMQGQTISIGSGANAETAVIASLRGRGPAAILVTSALAHAYTSGAPVAGSGITVSAPLSSDHALGAQIGNDLPTPGMPNLYSRK